MKMKPLPDDSFFMHNFSIHGLRTVDVLEINPGNTVEIAGKFERKGYDKPHIDLVAIINPRQNQFWLPVGIRFCILWVLFLAFIYLTRLGNRIRNVAKSKTQKHGCLRLKID